MRTKRKGNIKAFTVMELLIGLVISSIVIGMTYAIFTQISKQLFIYNKNQQELMEFNQFRQVFSKDIMLAKHIEIKNGKELELELNSDLYSYKFEKRIVIRDRNNASKDTFDIAVSKIELDDVKEGNEEHQKLTLQTSLMGEHIILFESKKASIAQRINKIFVDEY